MREKAGGQRNRAFATRSNPRKSEGHSDLQMRGPSEDLFITHEPVGAFRLYREPSNEFSGDDGYDDYDKPLGFSADAPSLGFIAHPHVRSLSQQAAEAVEKFGPDSLAFNTARLEKEGEVNFIIPPSLPYVENDDEEDRPAFMAPAIAVSNSSAFTAPRPKVVAIAIDDGEVNWPPRGRALSGEDHISLCKMLVERDNFHQYPDLIPYLLGCCSSFSAPAFISSLRAHCFSPCNRAAREAGSKVDCSALLKETVDFKALKRVTLDAKAQECPEYLIFSCLLACVEHALMPLVDGTQDSDAFRARINPVFRSHIAEKHGGKTNVAVPVALDPRALEWNSIHRASLLYRLLASLLCPVNKRTKFQKAVAVLAGCPSKRYTPGGQPSEHTLRFQVLFEVDCAFAAGDRSLKAVTRQAYSVKAAAAAAAAASVPASASAAAAAAAGGARAVVAATPRSTPYSPRGRGFGSAGAAGAASAAAPSKLFFAPGSVRGPSKGKGTGTGSSRAKGRSSARQQLQMHVDPSEYASLPLKPTVVFPFTPSASSYAPNASLAFDPDLPVKNLSAHAAAALAASASAASVAWSVAGLEPSSSRARASQRAQAARKRRGEPDKENSEEQQQQQQQQTGGRGCLPPTSKRQRPSAPAPGPSVTAAFASFAASFPDAPPPSHLSFSSASASASASSDHWGSSSSSSAAFAYNSGSMFGEDDFIPPMDMDLEPASGLDDDGELSLSAFPLSQ